MFGIACVCLTTLLIVADLVKGAPDYFHNNNVVGWIKLHKSPATFKDAYLTCYYEGAILASPINEALADILEEKKKMADSLFWIGTHSLFSEGDFLSVEGVPLSDMPISVSYGFEPDENCVILTGNRRAKTTNCTRLLPYMCYRNRREQPVNFECGTFDNKELFCIRWQTTSGTTEAWQVYWYPRDETGMFQLPGHRDPYPSNRNKAPLLGVRHNATSSKRILEQIIQDPIKIDGQILTQHSVEYKLEPLTGSCYKLHEERQEWSRANTICSAEGGYLAVINNEDEANILKNMSSKRILKISKFDDWEPMFIGLRDWDQTGSWSTVQGDTIKNVYHAWGWGQPDNLGQEQYCGSLLKTGKLDDTWCNVKAMFMCEKDPAKARFEYPVAINLTEPEAGYFTVDPEAAASF